MIFFAESSFSHTGAHAGNVLTSIAGAAGLYGDSVGVGTSARFNAPLGVAVDPTTGNVYVTNSASHKVSLVLPNGTVSTLAGVAGAAAFGDGTGSTARFNAPYLVAWRAGSAALAAGVVVADSANHRVRLVFTNGTVITLGGNGTAGHADGALGTSMFSTPRGVAVHPVTLAVYVSDGARI